MHRQSVGIICFCLLIFSQYVSIFAQSIDGEVSLYTYIGDEVCFSNFNPANNSYIENESVDVSWSYWKIDEIGDGQVLNFSISWNNTMLLYESYLYIDELPTKIGINFTELGISFKTSVNFTFTMYYEKCTTSENGVCPPSERTLIMINSTYILHYDEIPHNYDAKIIPYYYIILAIVFLSGGIVISSYFRKKTVKKEEVLEQFGITQTIEEEYFEEY